MNFKVGDKVTVKNSHCCCSRTECDKVYTIDDVHNAENEAHTSYMLSDGMLHYTSCLLHAEDRACNLEVDMTKYEKNPLFKPIELVININSPEELAWIWGCFNVSLSQVEKNVGSELLVKPTMNMQMPLFNAVDDLTREVGIRKIYR